MDDGEKAYVDDLEAERDRLREQRDELLGALEETRQMLHGTACQEEHGCWPACIDARSTIAAARAEKKAEES